MMLPILALRIGGVAVRLIDDTITNTATSPSNATASIVVASNGNVTETFGTNYQWLKGGVASGYEIRATLNSGAVTGDAFGSWLNLGTTRSWSLTRSTFGTALGSILLEIRPIGGSTIASATISFDAEVD